MPSANPIRQHHSARSATNRMFLIAESGLAKLPELSVSDQTIDLRSFLESEDAASFLMDDGKARAWVGDLVTLSTSLAAWARQQGVEIDEDACLQALNEQICETGHYF